MSAMAMGMSRAIRLELEKHGATLGDLPDDVLRDFATLVGAFAADMRDELGRRAKESGEPMGVVVDAFACFKPGTSEEDQHDFVEGLVRLASDMEYPSLLTFAFRAGSREVELIDEDDSGIGQV